MKVYVALGSNLGVPANYLTSAISKIAYSDDVNDIQLSRWYQSEAIGGPANQPDYLNAVCCFDYQKRPLELLLWLQQIEQESGRVREIHWGPRTLDLDIIWCENFECDTQDLTVPHPRAHERAFVLRPLQDLNADFELKGQPLIHWLAATKDQSIQPTDSLT